MSVHRWVLAAFVGISACSRHPVVNTDESCLSSFGAGPEKYSLAIGDSTVAHASAGVAGCPRVSTRVDWYVDKPEIVRVRARDDSTAIIVGQAAGKAMIRVELRGRADFAVFPVTVQP